jgi:hypothetical protein
MAHANPTNLGFIVTPLHAAYLHFHTMAHANPTITMGFIGTPILAANLNTCAVQPSNSSRNGLIGTSLLAAHLHPRAVLYTKFSLNFQIAASVIITPSFFLLLL